MLTLITATPGSGKTLRALELIFDYLNQGREVYSNIIGLKISGVRHINSDITNPFDWRDLPNGSVIVYDESHEHPAFRDINLIKDKEKMAQVREIGSSLSLHRHFGFDIVLITQSPRLIHADVLAQVGTHYHLRRVYKLRAATIYEFPEAQTVVSKSARRDAVNTTRWKFPKHLYKFYTSTEQDTHKPQLPLKYILILLFVFICLPAFVIYKGYHSALFNRNKQPDHLEQLTITPQLEINNGKIKTDTLSNSSLEADTAYELSRVAMIISDGTDCIAKNSFGELLQISRSDCLKLNNRPSFMSFARHKNNEPKQNIPNNENFQNHDNDSVSYTAPTYPDQKI